MMMRMSVPSPMYMGPLPFASPVPSRASPFHGAGKPAGDPPVSPDRQPGKGRSMMAFFVILVVLMVLVAALGSGWARPPRRVYRGPVVDRRRDVIDEEVYEEPPVRPVERTRRVVRRRRY